MSGILNPLTDCSLFSPVLLSPPMKQILLISRQPHFVTGDSEAFVEGTTLLGEATRGENMDMRGENVANGLTLPTL